MDKLHILQIAPKFPYPPTDGGKISIYGVTKYLAKSGHNVDFVAYKKNDKEEEFFSKMQEVSKPYILDVQTDNSIWGAIKNLFSKIPYNISKYYSVELKEFLNNYFKENDPDIIHITNLHMGWVIDEVKKYSKAPVVLRQENLEMEIMKRFYTNQRDPILKFYSWIQYKKLLKFEPQICEKFDCTIMISETDKVRLKNYLPKANVQAIPLGVENNLLNFDKKTNEEFSLAHIGHLDWYPNYDSLKWFVSDILPELVNIYPQIKLYVFGGGEPKGFVIPDNIKEHVSLMGFVPDLWHELLSKHVAIVPLRIGSGIRVKILEMLAAGQNIISTEIGVEGIGVRNGRELTIANTKEEFIKSISEYFNGEINDSKLRENGKNFIKDNYTWERIIEKFELIYMNLIKDIN